MQAGGKLALRRHCLLTHSHIQLSIWQCLLSGHDVQVFPADKTKATSSEVCHALLKGRDQHYLIIQVRLAVSLVHDLRRVIFSPSLLLKIRGISDHDREYNDNGSFFLLLTMIYRNRSHLEAVLCMFYWAWCSQTHQISLFQLQPERSHNKVSFDRHYICRKDRKGSLITNNNNNKKQTNKQKKNRNKDCSRLQNHLDLGSAPHFPIGSYF